MEGIVRFGINNRYSIVTDTGTYECTLKGKQLKTDTAEYAALAPGDRVEMSVVSDIHFHGVIVSALPRSSHIARWNNKKQRSQVFAANIDLVVCVVSSTRPDFRPRFVDRVLVTAEWFGLEVLVVVNKIDYGYPEPAREYLEWIEKIAYRVLPCSALQGTGIDRLRSEVEGRRSVLIGHSGVGKSSIVNQIVPGADLAVRRISDKYQKGVHTTRFARMLDLPGTGWIVDGPGIREIELVPEMRDGLSLGFPEFESYASDCAMPGCTHTHEPGCKVSAAVQSGLLPGFRYESYCILYESLEERFQSSRSI